MFYLAMIFTLASLCGAMAVMHIACLIEDYSKTKMND